MLKFKQSKGFTLIEIFLIVFLFSLITIGVYKMQSNASNEVALKNEEDYILNLFNKIDSSSYSLGKYQNISLDYLKQHGYTIKPHGFNLVSISSPNPTRLEAEYNNLSKKECSNFVSRLVNLNRNHSSRINGVNIPTQSNPDFITKECTEFLNNVVIIRDNNLFGVNLNTNLEGVRIGLLPDNVNPCPSTVCNTIPPFSNPLNSGINISVLKPTITFPSFDKPEFTITPPPPIADIPVEIFICGASNPDYFQGPSEIPMSTRNLLINTYKIIPTHFGRCPEKTGYFFYLNAMLTMKSQLAPTMAWDMFYKTYFEQIVIDNAKSYTPEEQISKANKECDNQSIALWARYAPRRIYIPGSSTYIPGTGNMCSAGTFQT